MISRLRAAEHRTCHAGVIMLKICTRRSISALLAACLAQNLERSTSLAPCWNVNRWSRAPGITISQRGIPWIVRSRATILVRPCAALGELKVARIHDIRFILCLGCCVCVGAGKGATSDKLQLTVDASTRERMHACLSLILIRI